jgi:hypothetical protein
MAARPIRLPSAAPVPRAALLLRRRQQIIVRSPMATEKSVLRPPRAGTRTLQGLGEHERSFRERADTLPAPSRPGFDAEETPPVSGVRVRVREEERRSLTDLTPRARPVTLIDGVHDDLSHSLLEEAKRLLASGIFDDDASDPE